MEPVDEHFLRCVAATDLPGDRGVDTLPAGVAAQLDRLFQAQAQSRHLDFAARRLQAQGDGFYTISNAE